MKDAVNLPRRYLSFPERRPRMSGPQKVVHALVGVILSPIYFALACMKGVPGLVFRMVCAKKGGRLLLRSREYSRAHQLLTNPMDSVRYFEFEFMWAIIQGLKIQSYLDVSSPRMLPLMVVDSCRNINARLINPDQSDLAETIALANLFLVNDRCKMECLLLEEVSYSPETFDLITSMSVIEHIEDDCKAIRKMWSLLKPGGVLLISVPCSRNALVEYTNLNDYGLMEKEEDGYVFWQRYYDQELIQRRIYAITGLPRRLRVYGEKRVGNYDRNVMKKRSDLRYPYWREPYMMGVEFDFVEQVSDLPGMGVIAMEFVKPIGGS